MDCPHCGARGMVKDPDEGEMVCIPCGHRKPITPREPVEPMTDEEATASGRSREGRHYKPRDKHPKYKRRTKREWEQIIAYAERTSNAEAGQKFVVAPQYIAQKRRQKEQGQGRLAIGLSEYQKATVFNMRRTSRGMIIHLNGSTLEIKSSDQHLVDMACLGVVDNLRDQLAEAVVKAQQGKEGD